MEHNAQDKVKHTITSLPRNLVTVVATAVAVAFCAGIHLGMATHGFYNAMFSPNVPVSHNE
jgi:hypothetical protein